MAKLDIDKIVSEYFMLKTVLNNKYAMDVMSGKVQPAGPSAAADLKTLQAMQRYVKILGETVIPGNGLSAEETIDSYVERLMNNFKASELAKPEGKRLAYSDNPFEDSFKSYVSTVLSSDNARTKIEGAIKNNESTLYSVNSLVVNLGGKKQSSYVKLLSQSTELFSSVSGLRNEISTLESQKKVDQAQIESLQRELEEKTKEAAHYKDLCDKAIDEIGDDITYNIMVGMLKQTSDGLEGIVRSEAQKTREHVTEQTEKVVDLITAKDKIKTYMFEQGKSKYPRFFMILKNEKPLNNKGMSNLYLEIVDAAKNVGFDKSHPAVESLHNDMREQRLKNENAKKGDGKKSSKSVKVLTAALVLAVVGSGFLGFTAYKTYKENQGLKDDITNITQAFDDTFKGEYTQYQARENQQYDDYVSKVQIAIADNTLVSLPGVTPTPGKTNGEVWTTESLALLIDKYASDDTFKVDLSGTLAGVDWSRTNEMRVYTQNAENQIRADFYQNHYDLLVNEVANLNGQINNLNSELDEANALNASLQAEISSLKGENQSLKGENQELKAEISRLNEIIAELNSRVQTLEAQIDSLNAIIDAASKQNSELADQVANLTQQLNEAKSQITSLQQEVDSLSAENAQLRQEVANLKQTIADLQNEINSLNGKVTVLETENKTLATDKADLINEVNRLKDRVSELEKQIEEMGDVEGLYQEKAQLEEKVSQLEERVKSLESTNQQLTDKISDYDKKVGELENTIKQLTEDLNNANADKADLNAKIDQLTKELGDARNAYNDLYQQYQDLLNNGSPDVAALEEKLNEAYGKIDTLQKGIVDFYNKLTKSNLENSEAEQALEELFKLFGINYSESDSPSNDNSEYQPQP